MYREQENNHLEWPDHIALNHCKIYTYILNTNRASQVVLVVKNLPANAGDVREVDLILGSGRSPEGGHGNSLQYSYLENPMERGAWRATVHRVAQSLTRLKQLSMHIKPPTNKKNNNNRKNNTPYSPRLRTRFYDLNCPHTESREESKCHSIWLRNF